MPHTAAFTLGCGAATVGAVLLLSLLSKGSGGSPPIDATSRKRINHLVRVACSQGAQAAQDKNPVIALVHVATAKAYLDAAQHMSGGVLTTASGVDTTGDIRDRVAATTRAAMKAIAQRCPKLAVSGAEHFSLGAGWVV